MSLDLSYSAGLSPVFHFVPSGYVLDGTTVAELILRTRDGAELYRSGDGITVVDITLTKAMRFGDGTVLPSGSTVKALRVAPDMDAIDPPLADPADNVPTVYRYGLYVGTEAGWDWDVQGLWTVNPDTGPVRGMCGPQAVCVGPVMVAVNVCGVSAGAAPSATRATLLTLTQDCPSGTSFFVNSGGTHYIKSGADGDLRADASAFDADCNVQLYLNGTKLIKSVHLLWLSRYSFTAFQLFHAGDFLEIIS